MPNTPDLITRTRAALSSAQDVVEKKMFGSTGFMVRGRLCVAARADRIMCRVDPTKHAALVRRKGCTTVVMKGREYRGYVYVRADALTSTAALASWIELTLQHNASLAEPSRLKYTGMLKASRSLAIFLATLLLACARHVDTPVTDGHELRAELLRRYAADSVVREAFSLSMQKTHALDSAIARRMVDVDTSNTAWLVGEITRGGWPTRATVGADGVSAAFLLVQHADRDTAFQARMLPLIERAFAAGEVSGAEMALFTDRLATGRGLDQTYGTQADVRDGRAIMKRIRDSAGVDARRALMGLPPLQDYVRTLDSLIGAPTARP